MIVASIYRPLPACLCLCSILLVPLCVSLMICAKPRVEAISTAPSRGTEHPPSFTMGRT